MSFLCTAHRYSKTGRNNVQAFTVGLDLSKSWNLFDSNGIRDAGSSTSASKIVTRTSGGMMRPSFPLNTDGFCSATCNNFTASAECCSF